MDPSVASTALTTGTVGVLVEKLGGKELMVRAFGPSADLIGDRLKMRLERVFEKAAHKIETSHGSAQIVPDRVLVPLIRAAALEDNDTLQELWAGLLAGAATDPATRPLFVEILKGLSPEDAMLLNWFYSDECYASGDHPRSLSQLVLDYAKVIGMCPDPNPAYLSLDTLQSLGLIERYTQTIGLGGTGYGPTTLGQHFVAACRGPESVQQ